MIRRYEYSLSLSEPGDSVGPVRDDLRLRVPRAADAAALAELMIEAYRDTIDYGGQTLRDAQDEVGAFLAGERGGPPLLDESLLAFVGRVLVGACLVGEWRIRGVPMVSYIMTHPEWKGCGVAKAVLGAALTALRERGAREVRAVITEGNVPSERLFTSTGFRKLGSAYAGDPR